MENTTVQQASQETDDQLRHVEGVIESLLFVNERPVTLEQIKKVLETVGSQDIKKAVASLQHRYEERKGGIMIVEIAGGYQMLSNPAYVTYLRSFYKTKHKTKLSKPALESMAIIAYKEPVTRSDIEMIRGVNSDGVVAHLLDKELIKVVGRKDVPGRPFVYGTTKQFLEYFGLKSLDDLPALEEFPTLQPAAENNAAEVITQTEEETASESEESKEGEQEFANRLQDTEDEDGEEQEEPENKEEPSASGEVIEEVINKAERQILENEPEQSA